MDMNDADKINIGPGVQGLPVGDSTLGGSTRGRGDIWPPAGKLFHWLLLRYRRLSFAS